MTTSREIINDLRAQARRLESTGNDHLRRSFQRGADEIEMLLDEAFYLRAALEDEECAP